MTLELLTEDRTTLPTALLPLAKTQMRVDTSDDDEFIKSLLARAIARFQETNEVTVNPSTFRWAPGETDFGTTDDNTRTADLPVRPVTTFAAGIPPDDVTADYSLVLKWDGVYGVPIQQLQGAPADGLSVDLTAGYADLAAMPDAVQDHVLRHTAFLYEYREIVLPEQPFLAPDIAHDATWWMPRL